MDLVTENSAIVEKGLLCVNREKAPTTTDAKEWRALQRNNSLNVAPGAPVRQFTSTNAIDVYFILPNSRQVRVCLSFVHFCGEDEISMKGQAFLSCNTLSWLLTIST